MNFLKARVVVLLVLLCLFSPGCALLKLPFQVVGELLQIISKMPKPPPGVF
jgi:hypothetical protein